MANKHVRINIAAASFIGVLLLVSPASLIALYLMGLDDLHFDGNFSDLALAGAEGEFGDYLVNNFCRNEIICLINPTNIKTPANTKTNMHKSFNSVEFVMFENRALTPAITADIKISLGAEMS